MREKNEKENKKSSIYARKAKNDDAQQDVSPAQLFNNEPPNHLHLNLHHKSAQL